MGRPHSIAARPAGVAVMIVCAALALTVSGCDLMTATVTPQPSRLSRTPEPFPTLGPDESDEIITPRPDPNGGPDLVDAANALADLASYRVAVVSTGLVPAIPAGGRVSMTSTLIQGDHPAAAFTMVGVDGLEGGRLQAVVIGDEAWLEPGAKAWARSPGGAADFDAAFTSLSPIDLAARFEDLSASLVAAGTVKRNGIQAGHYHAAGGDATAGAGLTSGAVDLWLAVKGGYLVALDLDGTWDLDGTPTPVTLRIDVSHVNDRANVVKPPA